MEHDKSEKHALEAVARFPEFGQRMDLRQLSLTGIINLTPLFWVPR